MRLFVALRLEPGLLREIGAFQTRLRRLDVRRQVRWVGPDGMHLTLKFLGEVEAARRPALEAALDGVLAGRAAPILGLSSPGAFPNLWRPRVLWVALVETGATLLGLQAEIEAAAARLGWEREKRPFQPHLTLGRVREARGGEGGQISKEITDAMSGTPLSREEATIQPRVALMQSHLSPSGARYEELRAWSLT